MVPNDQRAVVVPEPVVVDPCGAIQELEGQDTEGEENDRGEGRMKSQAFMALASRLAVRRSPASRPARAPARINLDGDGIGPKALRQRFEERSALGAHDDQRPVVPVIGQGLVDEFGVGHALYAEPGDVVLDPLEFSEAVGNLPGL